MHARRPDRIGHRRPVILVETLRRSSASLIDIQHEAMDCRCRASAPPTAPRRACRPCRGSRRRTAPRIRLRPVPISIMNSLMSPRFLLGTVVDIVAEQRVRAHQRGPGAPDCCPRMRRTCRICHVSDSRYASLVRGTHGSPPLCVRCTSDTRFADRAAAGSGRVPRDAVGKRGMGGAALPTAGLAAICAWMPRRLQADRPRPGWGGRRRYSRRRCGRPRSPIRPASGRRRAGCPPAARRG